RLKVIATSAPARASASALARPNRFAPPVISTVLPNRGVSALFRMDGIVALRYASHFWAEAFLPFLFWTRADVKLCEQWQQRRETSYYLFIQGNKFTDCRGATWHVL